MSFSQLVEELQGRPAAELDELAELAKHYAIEQRRAEILENALQSKQEWSQGELKAYNNIDDLIKALKQ